MKGRAFLFLEAGRRVYRCQFTKDLTTIGSGRTNDIVIKDESVDEDHAQISRAGDVYTLRSIQESEVSVDGEEVEGGFELMNGNRIEVGDTEMLFVREQHEAPTTVHLIIRKQGEPPMGFWSAKSTVVIGREKGDIIIDDPLLSKVHAIVENFCTGGQFVLDARSERGTGLNGESIEARHRLVDGDVITLGSIEIEFRSNPYASEHGQDAMKLAEETIGQLRKQGAFSRVSSEVDRGKGVAPRNPYQRYPSQLPDADPPPPSPRAPIESDVELDQPRRKARRRGGRMDLRSGVQTGIVSVQNRGSARPPPRKPKRSRSEASLPSLSGARRPDPTYEPEDLPNFKPRPHWGDPEKRRRGFGDRAHEQDTRLSLGNADDSGVWYVPGGGRPQRQEKLGKPIIKARGDKVPEVADAPPDDYPERRSGPQPQQARIRRPAAGPIGPGSSPIRPMRADVSDRRQSERPPPAAPPARARRAPSDADEAPQIVPSRDQGARPDDRERWYIPEEDQKKVRQKRGDAAWYMPEGKKKKRPSSDDYADEYGDRHERPEKEKKSGGRTQVFNGDDY